MKIYIGADHAGFTIKEKLKGYLEVEGYVVEDLGAKTLDPNDDYPDFVLPVAENVASDLGSRGIILGGTGQGEAICANKVRGIRAALFYGRVQAKHAVDISGRESSDSFEIVKLSRLHNDSNVLSLSARFLDEDEITKAVKIWLETPFSGDERHVRRVAKLDAK